MCHRFFLPDVYWALEHKYTDVAHELRADGPEECSLMLSNCMWLEQFFLRLPTMGEYGAWLYSRTIQQLEENYRFYKKILKILAYGQGNNVSVKDTCYS